MPPVQLTLQGGPGDGRVIELFDPGPTIQVGHPTGWYVRDASDPTLYVWDEDGRPPAGPSDPAYVEPFDPAFLVHLGHLKAYLEADPGTITNAASVEAIRDLIRAVRWLNGRLAEG